MRARKDSPSINTMMKAALKKEPEVFGMALHVYADTFAHQGFSGIFSKENDIDSLKSKDVNLIKMLIYKALKKLNTYYPTYGHMQALALPDDPTARWEYLFDKTPDYLGRLNPKAGMAKSSRNNGPEYAEAFEKTAALLKSYLKKNPAYMKEEFNFDENLYAAFFKELGRKTDVGKREKSWRKFITANNLFDDGEGVPKYDSFKWIKEAFPGASKKGFDHYEISKTQFPSENFSETSWFKFITGVRWFREESIKSLAKNYGLEIPHPYPKRK